METEDILKKLSEIESRLARLEAGKVILEERKIPADVGELEGKTYYQTANGGIQKEIRVGVCDICGRSADSFNICVLCGRKLCENCSIVYRNQIYCRDCLHELLPLSKEEYKVLLAISKGIRALDELAEITKTKRAEVKACIKSLTERELIKNSSFLFFSDLKILGKGLEALATYRQVYGRDEDIVQLESEVEAIESV